MFEFVNTFARKEGSLEKHDIPHDIPYYMGIYHHIIWGLCVENRASKEATDLGVPAEQTECEK